jgi:glycosyltransferase involved in cell wall biosynthesis
LSEERPPLVARGGDPTPLRICIAYDRLYPWSIGGAERWYRRLAERLASDGHYVTYLTTRQWAAGDEPRLPGVRVIAIARDDTLYGRGHRRLGPVLRFGLALWLHLLRFGRRYDVVHSSAMSSWATLAAAALARLHRYRLILDWWEVWPWAYWRRYLGPAAGAVGWLMQGWTARLRHQPIVHSELHATRFRRLQKERRALHSRGLLATSTAYETPARADQFVIYAGRFIPEKQVPAIVAALAHVRKRQPALRACLIGDGPDEVAVRDAIRLAGLDASIDLPGFVSEETLAETLRRALCLVLLSRREGYGLVVAEAASLGVPSVVLRHPDSAAAELIVEGVNGFTCATTNPGEVASAILRVHDAGDALRRDTLAWFQSNTATLTMNGSLPRLLDAYRGRCAMKEAGR